MRIDILTLFPGILTGPIEESLLKKARDKGLLDIRIINIRDFTVDKHKTADDNPYGGGAGMVLKPEPVFKAVESVGIDKDTKVILLSPAGNRLSQKKAKELAKEKHLVLICGHYEGIDERVKEELVTEEISIGDYVLTGGELPALVLIDAVARFVPGVVKEKESVEKDSFNDKGLLDYPCYTRPEEFRGKKVPEVLLSGNHKKIEHWRKTEALRRTLQRRPDLIDAAKLDKEEQQILKEISEQ
ncbi:MAG: tRNA (guanosine(37)-N1)-methyltransferase TrmD [Candidatus Saganbacteria bacterium]|nr:tRNA (guanosine(37)-N1)-methyltransferase TrmD [Candidatus Saganbacteria bacterium]